MDCQVITEELTRPASPQLVQDMEEHISMEQLTVHDGEYYIESADCVIRVDNTLFKVHRYLLGRDSSVFLGMFNMPTNVVEGIEGCSDEIPIRLYGESVERFRALISVIYATPLELQVYSTPASDIERLLTIAEVTNKFNFASYETWAVDALYHVVSGIHGTPPAKYALNRCCSSWMKRLSEVAFLCGHSTLLTFVAQWWVDRIVTRELRPIHALEIADRSGVRELQGHAYYVQLLEMDEDFEPGVVEDGKQYSRSRIARAAVELVDASIPAGTPANVTREQRERLLRGFWSLSQLWRSLRSNPPTIPESEGCTAHQHKCVPVWSRAWSSFSASEDILKISSADVLGRLRVMDKQLFKHAHLHQRFEVLPNRCVAAAAMALKTIINEVEEGLADHFVPRIRTPEMESTALNDVEDIL